MKIFKYVFCIAVLLSSVAATAETVLIRNAKLHTLTAQGVLDRHDILITNDRIVALGQGLKAGQARIIEAQGKVVTPGIMALNTEMGVVEIDAIDETVDAQTSDTRYSASFGISEVFNPHSSLIAENRRGGVTRALIRPYAKHHLFSGQAAVMQLNGEYAARVADQVAVYGVFGEYGAALSGGSRASALLRLQQALADTREYMQHRAALQRGEWRELSLPLNDLQALIPIVNGERPLVLQAHRASDILTLLQLARREKIRLVIDGAAEAWQVADQLARAKVPVIIDPIENLPQSFERLNSRLENAALLHKAGVQLLFSGPGTHNAYLVRQSAGNAVAYGLPHEAALRAMISHPAEVFGVGRDYGYLGKGALAELVVWDGDPLEVTTNAEHIMIDGKLYAPESRATRLRDRYKNIGRGQYNPAYIK